MKVVVLLNDRKIISVGRKKIKEEYEMEGIFDAGVFAEYLNHVASEKGIAVNFTKMQKWLYICYGLYLVEIGEVLLKEKPQAWYYGPFFPKVHELHHLGLEKRATLPTVNGVDSSFVENLVDATLEEFRDWTATELVDWTHEEGTAWDKKYRQQKGKFEELDESDIRIDFRKILQG